MAVLWDHSLIIRIQEDQLIISQVDLIQDGDLPDKDVLMLIMLLFFFSGSKMKNFLSKSIASSGAKPNNLEKSFPTFLLIF
jgi:hypothetical protein